MARKNEVDIAENGTPGERSAPPKTRARREITPEHRAKIAEAMRRRWQDPEHQAKVAEGHANKVKVQTPEGNQARADFQRQYWQNPPQERLEHIRRIRPDRTGTEHHPETKQKISQKMRGRTLSPEHKEAIRQSRLRMSQAKREAEARPIPPPLFQEKTPQS